KQQRRVHSARAASRKPKVLKRRKREWILPPAKLYENQDYTKREFIAKIRSDLDTKEKVEYFLSGPGADKVPINLFRVDRETGFVRVTDILDREKQPFYNLTGVAKYTNGTPAEADIPLMVTVLDKNDNPPYFELHVGNVTESSKKGTELELYDDDQAGTINSDIAYTIISQEPAGTGHMFRIEKKTGKLYVKEPTLDRETHDFYKLVIQGVDMGGGPKGLTGTGTVEIKVLDINDNVPTLEKKEYDGTVDENVADVVVMRIKAIDKDLEHTDNWLAVFDIAKGNEDGLFSIETDKETNEGVLKLIKAVDFEEVQNLELGLLIENVAPFVVGQAVAMDVDVQVGEGGGGLGVGAGGKPGPGLGPGAGLKPGPKPAKKKKPKAPGKSYPVKIAVKNLPEGPEFKPSTKPVPVSEDPNEMPEDGVITVFSAIDPDNGKQAEDVTYAKAFDPDNWLTIDEETAEIKLNKVPDRESKFLKNGTYVAKILCITKDMPSKTATGTLAIQVVDSNDHCPSLTTNYENVCADEKTVYVTGFDEDVKPNSAPFSFRIVPEGTKGNWDVEVINETTAALHSHEPLWPGEYELEVEVKDAQGLSCPSNEVFKVEVCTCTDTGGCGMTRAARQQTTSSNFSGPALGALLSAMCLLLFIPLLLLFCQCGGANSIFPDQFTDLPFDATEHLISYHTEGKGDDKVSLLVCLLLLYDESMDPYSFGASSTTFTRYTQATRNTLTQAAIYDEIALPDTFLNDYYSQKALCATPMKDCLLEYDYEGQGSPAGSVGCCSLLESDNDLQFLNDLGPKFKTLAEICSPPKPVPVKLFSPPKVESIVKTTAGHVKTEKVISATNVNISKSSISTNPPSNIPPPLPSSKVTSISHSSANINQPAPLPPSGQTLLLQQQPMYYTTTPVVQPMHYINSPPGMIIQGIKSPKSSTSTASITSPVIVGPAADGNYVLTESKISSDEAQGLTPGSSRGTLPRGAILVKEAVPPQGVLGPAAQSSVYGILPGHTVTQGGGVVLVNRNLGQSWAGQPGQIRSESVTLASAGVGQPRMGHVVAVEPEVRHPGL
uniref:Si:ch73-74h11.1 n=1 Tax=Myripristis murdjan TaxID=586833 RepID=A0A667WU57_9TELE